MDPTNVPPNPRCSCRKKWCTGGITVCRKVQFKHQCPAGCGSKPFGREETFRLHVTGNDTRNGCRPYAKTFPLYIESYTSVYDENVGKYRPNFVLDDRKGNDRLSQKKLDTRAKKWQKVLKKDEDNDKY